MDATADKDPVVQEQIFSALCSLGRAEPEEVLNACEEYLRQHEKVGHPSAAVSVKTVRVGKRISAWMGRRGDSGRLFWKAGSFGEEGAQLAGDALAAPEHRCRAQVGAAPHLCPSSLPHSLFSQLAHPYRVILLKAMEAVVKSSLAQLDKSTAKIVIFLASSEMTKSKVSLGAARWGGT